MFKLLKTLTKNLISIRKKRWINTRDGVINGKSKVINILVIWKGINRRTNEIN